MARNRSTTVRFAALGGHIVRVILSRSVHRTGLRLGEDIDEQTIAIYIEKEVGDRIRRTIIFGPEPSAAIIAHEAAHAVRAMLKHRGVRNDDEVFAHHLAYLVDRIHKFLK